MNNISIIIPLYNYANRIGEAIQSAKDSKPAEIIVVDDASTDKPVIPKGVKLIRFDKNQGVAIARNVGIAQAKNDLILCLDADDKLIPGCLPRLIPEFNHPRTGIAFAPLDLVSDEGQKSPHRWFEEPFDFHKHRLGQNMVPTCAVFRKTAWQRAGGFRTYEKPCEDAGFWLRVASQGWIVKNIGGQSMLEYRMAHKSTPNRKGSETQINPGYNWWKDNHAWAWRSSGTGELFNLYDCQKVSFVIDYRVKTEQGFIRTLDSIEGIKGIDWEVCATGTPPPLIRSGWPWVRWNQVPSTLTEVYLEPGDILSDDEWAKIMASREFPQ
jgi:glycosyltransferase involved in cell wall biosynthesis